MEQQPTAVVENKAAEAAITKPPEHSALTPERVAALRTEVSAALSTETRPATAAFGSDLEAKVARLSAAVKKYKTMQSAGAKELLAVRSAELAAAKAKLAGGGGETITAAVTEAAPLAANETPDVVAQAEQALDALSADTSLTRDAEFASRKRLFAGAKTSEEKQKFAAHLLKFAEARAAKKQKTEAIIAGADQTAATHAESVAKSPEPKTAEQVEDEATRAKRQRITELSANLKSVDLETYALRKQLQKQIGEMNPSNFPPSLAFYAEKVGKGSNSDDANFMAEAEAFLKTQKQTPIQKAA